VAFRVAQKCLERLEWSGVLERLADRVRTPAGRARLVPAPGERVATGLFETSASGARARLAETAEARAIRAAGEDPPFGRLEDVSGALERARKGGVLEGRELFGVGAALAAVRETRRFFEPRAGDAPGRADLASRLQPHRDLEEEIERCLDPSGEVCDAASPALAAARRTVREIGAEITARLDRILRDPDVAASLSDRYFTVRNDRYVLPVRADARDGLDPDPLALGQALDVERHVGVDGDEAREVEPHAQGAREVGGGREPHERARGLPVDRRDAQPRPRAGGLAGARARLGAFEVDRAQEARQVGEARAQAGGRARRDAASGARGERLASGAPGLVAEPHVRVAAQQQGGGARDGALALEEHGVEELHAPPRPGHPHLRAQGTQRRRVTGTCFVFFTGTHTV